jgi:hypothetical protein
LRLEEVNGECKGRITRGDAEIVQAFAKHVADLTSRDVHARGLYNQARLVGRIAYCAIAEARAEERRMRIVLSLEEEYPHHVVE